MATNIFQDWQGRQTKFDTPTDGVAYSIAVANRVWDPVNLLWVSETQPAGGGGTGLTDAQLRASAVPVSLASTTVSNFPASQAVTGAFFQATQPVSVASWTGLTDAQLRAAAVPVSLASTTVTNFPASQAVTGPLTDGQLRASAVPVSLASTTVTNFPASQAVTGAFFQATQPVSVSNAATVDYQGQSLIRDTAVADLLTQVLLELRVHSAILHSTLNCTDDITSLRLDAAGAGSNFIQ